jgi:hypothetical protein
MSAPSPFVYSVAIALAGLVIPSASAQVAGSQKPAILGANDRSYTPATLGKDRPPGFGPYLSTNPSTTPELAPAGSPYTNPPAASGGYGGYGYPSQILTGRGSTLQGQASVIAATGQYYGSIQQASILREQKRQMSYQTTRDRLNLEMEYEDLKTRRYRQGLENDRQAILAKARRDPQDTNVWSGQTLNVLLKSILAGSTPTRGPNISLSPETVRGLNLTVGANRGSLALAKDEGKIDWTETLEDTPFDTPRKRFGENFALAMKATQSGEKPALAMRRDLEADLQSLASLLDEQVASLSPSKYIESRRLLNKLKDGVKGLSDNGLIASCNGSWRKNVGNVADLVTYCQQNGVEFNAAAAAGDKACYQAAYLAFRAYERETVQLASAR